MKAVRTVHTIKTAEEEYSGKGNPRWKVGDYVKVYCGSNQDHCFTVKDIRFNADTDQFEYHYPFYGWYGERQLTDASNRSGWHYDSQGYCDNPGRGY